MVDKTDGEGSDESAYSQLIKMQKNFWNVPSAYLKSQCLDVSKAVEEASPLNHDMRSMPFNKPSHWKTLH
jgi:hypothetical protein